MTLIVQGFTIALVLIAVQELILMEDPEIQNFTIPLNKENKAELVPLEFGDYDYVLAFSISRPLPPPEVGGLYAYIGTDGKNKNKQNIEFTNCTDLLSESTIDASSEGSARFGFDELTFCIKPDDALTSKFDDGLGSGPEFFSVDILPCKSAK